MGVYFDHTSSGLIDPDVLDVYCSALREFNYNPASRHADGSSSREALFDARGRIAKILDCDPEEIIFTSGGSESINTAIKSVSVSTRRRNRPLITFSGEHSATLETLRFAEKELDRTVRILPLKNAVPDLSALENTLNQESADLISAIWVNNDSGAITDVNAIADLRDRLAGTAKIHIDGVQALGKLEISFRKSKADLISFSAHKIGCPKGIGLLICDRKIPLIPLIHGGGQQDNRRSGTENPALVITCAYAMEKAQRQMLEQRAHCQALKEILIADLTEKSCEFKLLSPPGAVPHIVSLYFPSLRAETLQNGLSAAGFDVSIGSACSSGKNAVDEALLALGLSPEESRHVLRVSLSLSNTKAETLALTAEISKLLQQYSVG